MFFNLCNMSSVTCATCGVTCVICEYLHVTGSKTRIQLLFKMRMLLSVVLLLCLIFSTISCPDNCFCELYRAECHLRECSDQLFTKVDLLIIYGSLCENHKYIMKHVETGVQFLLKDATCEDIPNCR